MTQFPDAIWPGLKSNHLSEHVLQAARISWKDEDLMMQKTNRPYRSLPMRLVRWITHSGGFRFATRRLHSRCISRYELSNFYSCWRISYFINMLLLYSHSDLELACSHNRGEHVADVLHRLLTQHCMSLNQIPLDNEAPCSFDRLYMNTNGWQKVFLKSLEKWTNELQWCFPLLRISCSNAICMFAFLLVLFHGRPVVQCTCCK